MADRKDEEGAGEGEDVEFPYGDYGGGAGGEGDDVIDIGGVVDASPEGRLFAAAEADDMDGVEESLAAGVPATATDGDRNTPLHVAAYSGAEGTCLLLLDAGADPNAANVNGETPMHRAAAGDNPAVIALLASRGGRADALNTLGQTPARFAVDAGALEALPALLAAGARLDETDSEGNTLLHAAAADNLNPGPVIERLIDLGIAVDVENAAKQSPLHRAAAAGAADAISALTARGANLAAKDGEGKQPVHVCAESVRADGEVLGLLVTLGADVNAVDGEGNTALHLAAGGFSDSAEVVETLISLGASVTAVNTRGQTPLAVAVDAGADGTIIALLTPLGE